MKKTLIAPLLAVIGCAAVVATLVLGGSPKLNAVFEAKATSKSFTFNAATRSQFENTTAHDQVVNVETGVSSSIRTVFMPRDINSLAFGQNGRFVEAHPNADEDANYTLDIGVNNLTSFAIDVGVANDGGEGCEDMYSIELIGKGGSYVKDWYSRFVLDGDGNGTAHIEWDKEKEGYTGTVVGLLVELSFEEDSVDTNLYIKSISLTWEC